MNCKLIAFTALLLLSGCARPKPVEPPAPPAIEKKTYPKQSPRPNDMVIKNCTVTREDENKADCICRKASTKIDVNDPGKQVMVCK